MSEEYAEQVALETMRNESRFEFFFAGLVFAVLSFAIQYPVSSNDWSIKALESVSWVAFSATGLLALRGLGAFSVKRRGSIGVQGRRAMWGLFIAGVFTLLAAKILDSFC
jgi:hypothetical protein